MVHAVCDFCGEDCDRVATFITVTPFQNFGRYSEDTSPYGNKDKTKSFVVCKECMSDLPFPNHYKDREVEKLRYANPIVDVDLED